jgi:integrase
MAPKRRTKDKHLPARVYIDKGRKRKDGTWPPPRYFFKKPDNTEIDLGRTFTEAMSKWVELIDRPKKITTMHDLFDRYLLEVSPKKKPGTYRNDKMGIGKLRVFFGDMLPNEVTPVNVYQYLDMRAKVARRGANIEKAILSNIYSYAIRWGIVKDNPCKNVKRLREEKRNRYIEDWEFNAVLNIASEFIKKIMKFAYLTGLRKGDILTLKLSEISSDGIQKTLNKTETKLLIEWTDELKNCVNEIKKLPRPIRGMYLFCTRTGDPYTVSGFNAIWQRTIRKAIKLSVIQEKFRFNDIRRKSATDAEKALGREYARQLLGHTTQNMTANYISGVRRVKPLK